MSVSGDSTLFAVRGSEGLGEALDVGAGDLPVSAHNKSPYKDTEIISLDVGPTKTRYHVHRSILSQSPELAAKVSPSLKLWGDKAINDLSLPDLDEVTAHTLVHFLYTGRYQTLESNNTAEKGAVAAYKLSTCVYCAAIRYKLSGLAELAQEKITAVGQDLTIFDVLGVAREHAFPILPEDETWFPSYIEGAIKGAVAEDPGLFMKPGFVDQIEGDRKFRQVVMKAIVNTFSTGSGAQSTMPVAKGDPSMSRSTSDSEHDSAFSEPPPKSQQQNATTKQEKEAAAVSNGVKEDSVQLDDIEPTVPASPLHRPASPLSPRPPESVTDELDFKNSKTYQTMGWNAGDVVIANGTSKQAAHARNDSVIQAEDTVSTPPVEKEKEDVSPAPEAVDGAAPVSKKDKKKKKKKGRGAAAEVGATSPAEAVKSTYRWCR
ncbi:hypothetical protein N0V90_002390 [Kalmusia sp. IMI 367209]|nr:hypothetical protein N0V90_002390 [Kalmusia sp. IMI 367209]